MDPKKIWCNLGVKDLERTHSFYTKLGFRPNGKTAELVSFKVGEHDFIIHFFRDDILEANIKAVLSDPLKVNEVIFTISAQSPAQVDAWEKEVEVAGGTLITKAESFGEGYYGFIFADPDGHRFNVFYMEGL